MKRFFREAAAWLWKGSVLWTFLLVSISAVLVTFVAEERFVVEVTNVLLQVAAFSVAAYGLEQTRVQFRKPSLTTLARDLWATRPRFRKRPETGTAQLGITQKVVYCAPRMDLAPIDAGATVGDQIAVLARNIERIAGDVYPALKMLTELNQKNADGILSEEHRRNLADSRIDQKLESAMTDGLLWSFVGLLWGLLSVALGILVPAGQ